MNTKHIDSKGRLTLGPTWAGQLVIVDDSDPKRIILTPAVVIPAAEAWLYKNEAALASVRRGLEQAREGRSSPGPDLEADAKSLDLEDP